jgi:hypothetical protein
MSDDYLWDGSGTPDPDVQRLEALLGRLRTPLADAPAPRVAAPPMRWKTVRFLAPALATAAAVLLMIGLTLQTRQTSAPLSTSSTLSSWEVTSLAGQPRVGSTPLEGKGRIAVGQTLVTDGGSQARMTVGTIGQVTIDTDTRVRLVATRDGHHQLALERGTLHAVINAPPGQFVVDTPSAKATDLGCAYSLHVDEDGGGLLSVTSGWVQLELNGRESLVPVGASCRTDSKLGPGTPSYDDAGEEFRDAVDELDFGGDAARRARALRFVLDHADGQAVTLWHLIRRVDAADRAAVVDALAEQLPMPSGVTREAVLRLDAAALDQWWNALGLGDAGWWRKFSAPYPASR